MQLTLSEAARLLGKSEPQVRYLIRTKQLKARKVEGRWILRQQDLPLSEGQVRAREQKAERAARLATEILQPKKEIEGSKKKYSIQQTRAFQAGVPLYRELLSDVGKEHPAANRLRESLMLLACGYHEFEARSKADFYSRARQEASRATMALLLDSDEPRGDLIERLETSFLPALGGLIHQAERRGRGG